MISFSYLFISFLYQNDITRRLTVVLIIIFMFLSEYGSNFVNLTLITKSIPHDTTKRGNESSVIRRY